MGEGKEASQHLHVHDLQHVQQATTGGGLSVIIAVLVKQLSLL